MAEPLAAKIQLGTRRVKDMHDTIHRAGRLHHFPPLSAGRVKSHCSRSSATGFVEGTSLPSLHARELFVSHQLQRNRTGKEFLTPPASTFIASNLYGWVWVKTRIGSGWRFKCWLLAPASLSADETSCPRCKRSREARSKQCISGKDPLKFSKAYTLSDLFD